MTHNHTLAISQQPNPLFVVSSVMTGATRNLAKAMSKHLAQSGVTVNVVNPGLTQTPLVDRVFGNISKATGSASSALMENAVKDIPLGRIATPEDIAHYVGFLCGPTAAFLNGTTLNIDGGYTSTAW